MPTFKVGNESYTIPNDPKAIAAFKKQHPNAEELPEYFDPYKSYSEDELAKLLEDPSVLRKAKVKGQQVETSPGKFGEDVTVAEFVKRNPEYAKKFREKHGRDFSEKDAETFQKDYNKHVGDLAYERAKQAGYTDDEAKTISKRFVETQGFYPGTPVKGDPRGIDKKFGEYTSSRFEPIFKKKDNGTTPTSTTDTIPIKPPSDKTKKDETKVTTTEEIKRNPIQTRLVEQKTPWWLQDIIGVAGAATDLARIKRYPPWQATPNVYLPEGTFYDPTRELAANAEQANIQTQGLAAFTGPQALSARSSAIQGQALKNAADVMGRYNNLNVGLANELNQQRTQILNTASQNQANLDTQLWDKYTIMNQQFDNSKAQARQELRKHYINAITNRAKTQALNTLYPNYQVDPGPGGYVYATNLNYDPNPDYTTDNTAEKMWEKAQKIDAEHAADIFKVLMNQKRYNRTQDYPYQGYDEL